MAFAQTLFWKLFTQIFSVWILVDTFLSNQVTNVNEDTFLEDYDFIVGEFIIKKQNKFSNFLFFCTLLVGSGSAGSVVASRLSEVNNWTVLLLEAGGEQPSKARVPWFHLWLTNSQLDWKYVTEPQTNFMKGFENQVSKLQRMHEISNVYRLKFN